MGELLRASEAIFRPWKPKLTPWRRGRDFDDVGLRVYHGAFTFAPSVSLLLYLDPGERADLIAHAPYRYGAKGYTFFSDPALGRTAARRGKLEQLSQLLLTGANSPNILKEELRRIALEGALQDFLTLWLENG